MRIEKIGDATLYCGDCFDILPTLQTTVDAVITDPPYGCTCADWDTPIDLALFWEKILPCTKENTAICVFSQMPFTVDLVVSQKKLFRYDLVYQKQKATGFLNANKMPLRDHELILVFYRKLPTYNPQKFYKGTSSLRKTQRARWSTIYGKRLYESGMGSNDGSRYPRSVIHAPMEEDFFKYPGYDKHPTQKAVSVMLWLTKTYVNEGNIVLDPFMGSGTTGVAALKCGRKFIGIEKKEEYFDTACFRLEKALKEIEKERDMPKQLWLGDAV
ncbi:site-specific DNA-methyltransferase [uncultured Desulfovibrio sp.]|uniref:DNA-methyltransferase n=1 Tax=uncultured Desulfovibrio sp. TaxID=167968 RepID=UPI00272B6260|nr:site-specific DNA-methyltransferase [uncultured Desulfovibrio sp.]